MWLSYNVLVLQKRDVSYDELDFLQLANQQFSQLSKMMVAVHASFYMTVSYVYFAFSFSCKACFHGGLLCHHQWAGDLVCFQSDLCAAGHCFHGVPWIHYAPAWLIPPGSKVMFTPFSSLCSELGRKQKAALATPCTCGRCKCMLKLISCGLKMR